jgi:hypothetical protein
VSGSPRPGGQGSNQAPIYGEIQVADPHPVDARRVRIAVRIGALFVVALCLAGYTDRLRYPSVFYDDINRITWLQTTSLRSSLLIPFNEHLAPLFQIVTWSIWQVAGHRLAHMPLAITVASFIPFVLCVALMMRLVGRETRSAPTAWLAVAAFAISWLHAETVYWYSASSFTWALAWVLLAWLGVVAALGGATRRGWITAALASALAPACSGVGLTAGPLATLRALTDVGPRRRWDRAKAFIPLAGTLLYLVWYVWVLRYGNPAMSQQITHKINPPTSLLADIARATVGYLLPGLFGMGYHEVPRVIELALFGTLLVATLLWARRSPYRPLILCGLALILGGYGITYGLRADYGIGLLTTQRYHLLPQAGLALLAVPLIRAGLARCDTRRGLAPGVALALVVLMLAIHHTEMQTRARPYEFPGQVRTLKAMDRLAATCRAKRITRAQALAVLSPFKTFWSTPVVDSPGVNPLAMLPQTVATPGVSDDQVRSVLLGALTPTDRYLLCGGMVASRYLVPVEKVETTDPGVVGRLVAWHNVDGTGTDRFHVQSYDAFLEYDLKGPPESAADRSPARYLVVPGKGPLNVMEVWWAGDGQPWSFGRSLLWFPDPARTARTWAIPLDRLPHWQPSEARRLRVLFRTPGMVTLGSPRLLR